MSCKRAMPDTDFYKRVFGLESAPMARPTTLVMNPLHSALRLEAGQLFRGSGCAPLIAQRACYRSIPLFLMQMIVAH